METNRYSLSRIIRGCMASAILLSAAACTEKQETPTPDPDPQDLKDQIEYNGESIYIESAVFETRANDVINFYFSPSFDITDVEGMEDAADYIKVSVQNPDGPVDIKSEKFEISYKDIQLSDENASDAESISLNVSLDKEKSTVSISLDVKMKDGKTLAAGYSNKVSDGSPVVLSNQMELNGKVTSIASVLKWRDHSAMKTVYYFYSKDGVEAPSDAVQPDMVITVADGTSTENVDLSAVDKKTMTVEVGEDFSLVSGTTGFMNLAETEKDGKQAISLELEAANAEGILRAVYSGDFGFGYFSGNYFNVKKLATDGAKLTKVFRYADNGSNVFMLGFGDVSDPAGLNGAGNYALKVRISDEDFGKTIKLEESGASVALYDYIDYTYWDSAEESGNGATGSLTFIQTDETHYYMKVSASFPNGAPYADCEWFGEMTAASEDADLTPSKPEGLMFKIVSPEGEIVDQKYIDCMEVRLEKNYEHRGGASYGGADFDAYFFYFRPKDYTGDIESVYNVPQFMIPASFIPTDGELDLAVPQETLYWIFKFTNSAFSKQSYGENYEMYGYKTLQCPDDVKFEGSVSGKTWNFRFTLVDWGSYDKYNPDLKTGYKNSIVIDWNGPATKYTGSKKNDMADSDY